VFPWKASREWAGYVSDHAGSSDDGRPPADSADARNDIVLANPRARFVAIGSIVLGAAVGAPALYAMRAYFDRLAALAKTDAPAAIARFKTWIVPQLVVMVALSTFAGSWMIREGMRAYHAERYPRADMWVLHDTPIRRGSVARWIGIALIAIGTLVAVVPPLIVGVLAMLIWRVG
jgi:hypothetical protein